MRYVGGTTAEEGCLFCNRLAEEDDVRALILHRGERAFAIMNLYPYNTGHVMLVPTAHAPSPEDAEPEALTELALLLPAVTRALRRALGCHGFNVGMNVGAVAGAGVATHLHQHVVPRWEGDANFMPILASTMVFPELIPVTYAKLRAELSRDGGSSTGARVTCVALAGDDREVLVARTGGGWGLPMATAGPDEALWRAAIRRLEGLVPPGVDHRTAGADLVGWAGGSRTTSTGTIALTFRVDGAAGVPAAGARWIAVADTDSVLDIDQGRLVRAALANLAPSVAAP